MKGEVKNYFSFAPSKRCIESSLYNFMKENITQERMLEGAFLPADKSGIRLPIAYGLHAVL